MGQNSILTQTQLRFLDLVLAQSSLLSSYYWTGGTVLSEFYLHHRDSEDIDLFTQNAEVQVDAINTFISTSSKTLGASSVKYSQFLGLHTYVFEFADQSSLKVDFNYYPFDRMKEGGVYRKLRYDSIFDIAVNKMQTIATKPRSRDFIDLYMIHREYAFSLQELRKAARLKFDWYVDPLQLAAKYLLATEVQDLPRMRVDLPESEWREFFLTAAKDIQQEVVR